MRPSKIIIAALLCSAFIFGGAVSSSAEEAVMISAETLGFSATASYNNLDTPLSPGIRVMSYEKPMILSSMSGDSICFSAESFNDHIGAVPASIQILSLPSADSGILTYDSSPVNIGQSVSVLSLNRLSYEPTNSDDAEFTFSPDNVTVTRCVIRQRDHKNEAPVPSGDSIVTTYTKLNTTVGAYLDGADPDGDAVSFEIIKYPTKGILDLKDSSTGFFVYHPYSGMSGDDSFTYRIRDCWGEYSKEFTSKLNIAGTGAEVYDDMKDSCYTAAVYDAVRSGIMATRTTADGEFFDPHEPVSRIDFLIMTMKTMGAGEAEAISSTPFADDRSLTESEKGYLSAAYRLGIVKGSTVDGELLFMPDDAVTGAAAAVMINGILGLPEDDSISVAAMGESIPTWAIPSVSALTGEGIINRYTAPASEILTREDVAIILTGLSRKLA